MNGDAPRSRRSLIAAIAGGATLGGLWGAAFPIVATEQRPTLSVVGHRNAQIIVLDTSAARVLFLNGEPDRELFEMLPAVMTVFRQRIDLLVATPEVLGEHAAPLARRWRIQHAIAPSGMAGGRPAGIPTTTVADRLESDLGDATSLRLRVGHRNAWRASTVPASSPLWCSEIVFPAGVISIAPDGGSIAAIGAPGALLTMVPNAPSAEIIAVAPTAALAANYDSENLAEGALPGLPLTRIYPRDIARFVLTDEGVELPAWTTTDAGESDS